MPALLLCWWLSVRPVQAQVDPLGQSYEQALSAGADFQAYSRNPPSPLKPPSPPLPRSGDLAEILRALPATDVGRNGHSGFPLSLVFVGERAAIHQALKAAGWTQFPKAAPISAVDGLGQLVSGHRLTDFPPFHRYFLYGKGEDENWAQVVVPLSKRHHFRLWNLGVKDALGRDVWWGSASYDDGIRWKFIIPVTHNTDPDVFLERDYIAETLNPRPEVLGLSLISLPQIPLSGSNDQGENFETDGRALLVEFNPISKPQPRSP